VTRFIHHSCGRLIVNSGATWMECSSTSSLWPPEIGKSLSADFSLPGLFATAFFHAEHFPERFGLFTIILLGEFYLGHGFLAGRKATAAKHSTLSSPGAASALPNSQSA
jgi:hypothetical protein